MYYVKSHADEVGMVSALCKKSTTDMNLNLMAVVSVHQHVDLQCITCIIIEVKQILPLVLLLHVIYFGVVTESTNFDTIYEKY